MDREPFIIITVPHAECKKPITHHNCDYTALENAKKIYKGLVKNNIRSTILVGNINRKEKDLNREEGKNTLFHRLLDRAFERHKNQNILVLDVHSGAFKEDSPLIILDQPSLQDNSIIADISSEIDVTSYHGSKKNFIVEKSFQHQVPAVLMEFNENHEYSEEEYEKILRGIKKNLFI